MKIKEFVEQYNGYATDYLKEDFLKENLKITPYIPFVTKEAIARQIVKISTYDKKTGNIKLNSVGHHHLYCRMIIEYYTNLERENTNFIDEYDLLVSSGVFRKIMAMIPEYELGEFNMIIDMVRDDAIKNEYELHAFISNQIDRFEQLLQTALENASDKIAEEVGNLNEDQLKKLKNNLDTVMKRIK